MTRRIAILGAAILCGLYGMPLDTAAQSRPDFSGRWTSEPEPAAAPAPGPSGTAAPGPQRGAGPGRGGRGDMGSGWGATITLTQDAARLTLEYAFFGRGDMQPPMKFVYALDGSETRNTVMMGRGIQVQPSKAAWESERLVITTVHTFADPSSGKLVPFDVKRTLWLESPTALIVETTRSGVLGGPPSTVRTTYRKI